MFDRGLDQDWVDSANGFWTVLLLALCSVGAFLVRYVTPPISCFFPEQFTAEHAAYAKETCFMKEMYYAPMFEEVRIVGDIRGIGVSYHLWIPIILFLQALCFKIPNIIWNLGKQYLTINLDDTVDSLKQAQVNGVETRKSVFHDAAKVIGKLLDRNNVLLGILYLFVKLLFCLNLTGQFIFLTIYFRNTLVIKTSNYFGANVTGLIKPLFSKSVLCDFGIRVLANVRTYTVQCVLPISEIYEKLFMFLWYWVFFLILATFFNLLLWAGFLFLPFLRDSRISAYIKASHGPSQESSVITRFISGFLGIDGVLMLTMISRNSSEIVSATLTQHMYQVFLEQSPTYQAAPSTGPSTSAGPPGGVSAPVPVAGDIRMENLTYRGSYDGKPPVT